MNSSTSRKADERQRREEIKKQIEELKGQLGHVGDNDDEEAEERAKTLKRKMGKSKAGDDDDDGGERKGQRGALLLAPDTPSPKKKRKVIEHGATTSPKKNNKKQHGSSSASSSSTATTTTPTFSKPAPSNLLSKLASFTEANKRTRAEAELDGEGDGKQHVERSISFDERVTTCKKKTIEADKLVVEEDDASDETGKPPIRDSRLALVEELEPGPYEFPPLADDPEFEKLEPHSGIRLVSRTLPHSTLYSYLIGRYYLSPSKLYSIIRLSSPQGTGKGGEGYDIPVPGDWVTIAVVAERGPIRFTRAPVGLGKDEEEEGNKSRSRWQRQGGKGSGSSGSGKNTQNDDDNAAGRGKKYVTLKLIDFGGGKKTVRGGDAFLNLLLFEADGFDFVEREKVYRGGSGGAFERMMDVREGDVVVLLNPRVLKPYQRASSSSLNKTQTQSQTNILALSPTWASSVVVLGRARDLGMCTVRKKDGKVCGGWCDLRATSGLKGNGNGAAPTTAVCEYHVLNAVTDRRAGRNEFAIGTSSLSTSAKYTHKHAYDPAKKWGLQPSNTTTTTTTSGFGATYVVSGHVVNNNETTGREGQARAKKVLEAREEERRVLDALRKGKGKAVVELERGNENANANAKGYSAEFVKSLGFDPAGRNKADASKDVKDKLNALEASLMARKKQVELGPKPGKRVRSGVVVPPQNLVDLDEL